MVQNQPCVRAADIYLFDEEATVARLAFNLDTLLFDLTRHSVAHGYVHDFGNARGTDF